MKMDIFRVRHAANLALDFRHPQVKTQEETHRGRISKAIDRVIFTERGCVEGQPQDPETARVLRLVPLYPNTAALRTRLCQWPWAHFAHACFGS